MPSRNEEFRQYITKCLMSHLVYSSPWYPQGNSINESCHRVLEHAIKCEVQTGISQPFDDLLSHITLAYNSTYQSAIGDAPYGLMFGTPPVLPGFQVLSRVSSEENRLSNLYDGRVRRLLSYQMPPGEGLPRAVEAASLKVGDFVLFPLSPHDVQTDSIAGVSLKYQPRWSLPAKILAVKDKQLEVAEYVTGRIRKAPVAQCQKLPVDIPESLKQLNWQHIVHHLPRRWVAELDAHVPPAYEKFVRPKGKLPCTAPPSSAPVVDASVIVGSKKRCFETTNSLVGGD
eukprot:GHVQ01042596.1.p1 GENE.GHVQ01042596.1~~GHVQ01042596.1.p1  ORF type:complete len:311 (-),score=25.49 GHVQ01042596.1:43-900(-)